MARTQGMRSHALAPGREASCPTNYFVKLHYLIFQLLLVHFHATSLTDLADPSVHLPEKGNQGPCSMSRYIKPQTIILSSVIEHKFRL